MKTLFTFALGFLISVLPALVWSATVPNADTPLFYLVASSPSSVNLLPLRRPGSGGVYASFLGSGAPALFYFWQGQLAVYDTTGTYRPFIDTTLATNGCTNFGALGFAGGSNTNKCASYSSFQLQSNNQDSQLGAELVFNYVGGFYACSSGQQVWYKINLNDGPANCQPIHLYTVPAY